MIPRTLKAVISVHVGLICVNNGATFFLQLIDALPERLSFLNDFGFLPPDLKLPLLSKKETHPSQNLLKRAFTYLLTEQIPAVSLKITDVHGLARKPESSTLNSQSRNVVL